MKLIQISLLILLVSITYSKKRKINRYKESIEFEPEERRAFDLSPVASGKHVANIKNDRAPKGDIKVGGYFSMDPLVNGSRRDSIMEVGGETATVKEQSSSIEMPHWKDEWREIWLQKKFEALNTNVKPGDTVNMAAARPWGVSCGDPNQQDMPWGNCVLQEECDSEFRIWRGDKFCGHSTFVCCSLVTNVYDVNQGIDQSFEGTSFETDIDEKRTPEGKLSNQAKDESRKKRQLIRDKRKRQIKKTIKKIIREIQMILQRISRNQTKARKRKTKWLRKYIKHLKKQYKHDRYSIKEIHDMEMNKTHQDLMKQLHDLKKMNQDFANNQTFRDIVVNGTVNKKLLRQLAEAYPEFKVYLDLRRSGRRMDPGEFENYLEYDIEYGNLYF